MGAVGVVAVEHRAGAARALAVVDGNLARGPGEAEGQPASRLGSPGQDIGQGVATLLPQRPGGDERGRSIHHPRQHVRPAAHHDHDGGRTGGGHRHGELLLQAGQAEVGGVAGLADGGLPVESRPAAQK